MYRFEVVNTKTGEVTYSTEDKATCLERLASALAYQYINKSAYIRRITRKPNYNGTDTYTVIHDNGYKWVITVKSL